MEYKNEANKQFRILLDTIEGNIVQNLMNVSVNPQPAIELKPEPKKPAVDYGKIDRNDPCPCGSGKKYKKCCGK